MSLEEDNKPILLEDLGMMYATEKSKRKHRFGLYRCGYCGKEFSAIMQHIKGGQQSCGCIRSSHRLTKHPLYETWNQMRQRCYNQKHKYYLYYGGRGISICEEWLDVKNFIKWVEATHPNIEGYTLDRIDSEGNYEPENCRWADNFIQAVNKRMTKNNTSGFVGVSLEKNKLKWKASIRFKHKIIYIGTFKTIQEAVEARDNYIIENNLPHKLSTEYKKE